MPSICKAPQAAGVYTGHSHILPLLAAFLSSIAALLTPAAALAQSENVSLTIESSRTTVVPGDRFPIAIVFDHQPGWHSHTNDPVVPKEWGDLDLIPTTLQTQLPDGFTAGKIQWPQVHTVKVDLAGSGRPVNYGVFEGKAILFVPISVAADAKPGPATLKFVADFQACDDKTCAIPQTVDLQVSVTIVATGDPALANNPAPSSTFAHFETASLADPETWGQPPEKSAATDPASPQAAPALESNEIVFDFFGRRIASVDPTGPVGFILLLLIAALGGFILNLTPCVLPVIPLKIMGLSAAAGNPKRTLYLGAVMSLGVVAFWMAIGFLISGIKAIGAVSSLFANPWFGLGIGAFIAIMALGMLGLFTIQLPNAVYSVSPKQESAAGSFMFGVMTALLGTPCFGPFAGSAAAWAAKQPTLLSMSAFAAIGAGMALPYLVLAAKPEWVQKVPRTGPASELVKQVMGLLLLAAAAFFVGTALIGLIAEEPYLGKVLHWWAVAIFIAAASVWLILRTVQITASGPRRATFGVVAVALAGAAVLVAISQTNQARNDYTPSEAGIATTTGLWRPYDPAAYQAAKADGKVVVVDFTAEWCGNCKTLKAFVLNTDRINATLTRENLIAFRADLTNRKAPGYKLLAEFGEVGIPLLTVEGPGVDRAWKSNAYTVDQVIAAVDAASARRAAAGGPR